MKGTVPTQVLAILPTCNPAPTALFCIAIEEIEALLLGDRNAVMLAYPKAKVQVLNKYRQDSICETWELLADAIYGGGARKLKAEGWPAPARAKCRWAEKIAPHVDIEANKSKSFQVFRNGVLELAEGS